VMECTLTIVLLVMNQRPYLDINSDGGDEYCKVVVLQPIL
jgi:hypothetical protein